MQRMKQFITGLAAMHEGRLCHGHLSLSNVLVKNTEPTVMRVLPAAVTNLLGVLSSYGEHVVLQSVSPLH